MSQSNEPKKIIYLETARKMTKEGIVREEENLRIARLPQESPFIKMYVEDLTAVLKLPAGTKDLLYCLLMKMDYENVITLTSRSKKEIAQKVGIKIQTFDNYLKKLVESGIFIRFARGEYKVNPKFFARGEWNKVMKQRDDWWTLTITYKRNGEREITGKSISAAENENG